MSEIPPLIRIPPPSVDDWLDGLDAEGLRGVIDLQSRDVFDLRERVREVEEMQRFLQAQLETVRESGFYEGWLAGMAYQVRHGAGWGGDS